MASSQISPSGKPNSARSKARRRALDILFEAEQREVSAMSAMTARREIADQIINLYTVDLVEGVTAMAEQIDEYLQTYSQGWTLERMPAVDRIILRIGAWELLFNDDVPDAVAIDEAVELVSGLSTDESPSFVNGLLARILELKPTILG